MWLLSVSIGCRPLYAGGRLHSRLDSRLLYGWPCVHRWGSGHVDNNGRRRQRSTSRIWNDLNRNILHCSCSRPPQSPTLKSSTAAAKILIPLVQTAARPTIPEGQMRTPSIHPSGMIQSHNPTAPHESTPNPITPLPRTLDTRHGRDRRPCARGPRGSRARRGRC